MYHRGRQHGCVVVARRSLARVCGHLPGRRYDPPTGQRRQRRTRPYPGPGGKVQISVAGGDQPMWSRDGKELYYRDGAKFIAVVIRTTPDIAVTSRTPLFDDRSVISNATNYDVLRD